MEENGESSHDLDRKTDILQPLPLEQDIIDCSFLVT